MRGAKGHVPETLHQALVAQVHALMPPGARVIFLGDGAVDGTQLQAELRRGEWPYVCRTASTILVTACGVACHGGDLGPQRGEMVALTPAGMTEKQDGPLSMLAIWEEAYQEPI